MDRIDQAFEVVDRANFVPKELCDAVDIDAPLPIGYGQTNAQRAGVRNASFFQAGDEFGLPEEAPYDRILVSASADQLPQELIDQLKVGGKMVIPVQHDILEITKKTKHNLDIKKHGGFAFVPLL